MPDERTEDLNPRSEDIDEKVRRMLDPSVPDEPAGEQAASDKPKKSTDKPEPKVVKSVPILDHNEQESAPSAPPLPSEETDELAPPSAKQSRKIINPPETKKSSKKSEKPKPERKIEVTDHNETPEELEKELNAAIAELEPNDESKKPEEKEKPEDSSESSEEAKDDSTDEPEDKESPEDEASKKDITVEEIELDEKPLSDEATNEAVEEIIKEEGDVLLDAAKTSVKPKTKEAVKPKEEPKKPKKSGRFKRFLKSKGLKKAILLLFLVSILAAAAWPTSRYYILNRAGVRVSSSVTVFDRTTNQPLKNVNVSIGGKSAQTDENGYAKLDELLLGPTNLKVEKLAFSSVEKSLILGYGSNPLGEIYLDPTGVRYSFKVTDFLSKNPLPKAEAASGISGAVAAQNGEIKLTVPETSQPDIEVKISLPGYRTETLKFAVSDQNPKEVELVPDHKHIFVSRRSGKYDIYSSYIDGKGEKLLLAGSGHEQDDLNLVPHQSENLAAFTATRSGQQNAQGALLNNLLVVDADRNDTTNIIAAEKIQIVGWIGRRLVYIKTGAGQTDPKRSRLMSYNYEDKTEKELASSNYFNDVLVANDQIYFAPSGTYPGGSAAKLFKVNADGGSQVTILDGEVWRIVRTSIDQLALAAKDKWYSLKLDTTKTEQLTGPPNSQTSKQFMKNPTGDNFAWVDNRDGKGVLLSYYTKTTSNTELFSQAGLSYVISWAHSRVVIFHVENTLETADYALSLDGGKPVKIRDVTTPENKDNWYYF